MMENEQNLNIYTDKGLQAETFKKCGQTTDAVKKMYKKNARFTSIYLRLLKCPAVTSTYTSQYL